MLDPKNDRIDYGDLLNCPSGCKLDFAVGTTYSLDLDALVGISLALGLGAETDSNLVHNPICLLEALRLTADKIALFCEGGQIHLPNKPSQLYILLEQMVYQVITEKIKELHNYPSFHPKFWLLRYIHELTGTIQYRVVVMSRNLTFDQSWDVTFAMDGVKTGNRSTKNSPISNFLKYLVEYLPHNDLTANKRNKIEDILKELPYIVFSLDSREFNDFEFIPVGIKKGKSDKYDITSSHYPLFNETFDELLVITPFLSKSVIRKLNANAKRNKENNILISRSDSISKLSENDCNNFSLFTLKDEVIDGESIISDSSENALKHDIHAKLYMTRKGSSTELYLGSLNASQNALHGNIEFIIKLSSKNRYLNLEKMKESLFGVDTDDNPFVTAIINEAKDDETKSKLDEYIKILCRYSHHAVVERNGDKYRISVIFEDLPVFPDGITIEIAPLLLKKATGISKEIVFEDIGLTDLSVFFKIIVSDYESTICRIIKIHTEGIPEEREKKIVSDVINNKEAFYRYIAFLLGDNYISSFIETEEMNLDDSSKSDTIKKPIMLPSLYEKMLKTAAMYPERLKEIGYLIESISEDNIIPEFEELYNTFKKAVKL